MNNDPCDIECGEDFFNKKERCTKHNRNAKQCVASIYPSAVKVVGLDGFTDDEWRAERRRQQESCNHVFIEQEGEPPVDVCTRCGKVER